MKYQITHKTWYAYAEPVPVCHNLVHLAPRTTDRQTTLHYQVQVDPTPAFFVARSDYFGNRVESFSIEGAHRELAVVARSTVVVRPRDQNELLQSPSWEECVAGRSGAAEASSDGESIHPVRTLLTFPSPRVPAAPALRKYAELSFTPRRPVIEALCELTTRIHIDFQFDQRATNVDTPLAEVLRLRRGVCQDFAHLIIGCIRSMGLAARYVSGYLRTIPPPGQPRLVGADASHAWTSAWCGVLGWVDFDPTNNCLVDDQHITVAWGRDYSDVCPIQGVFVGGGENSMSVSVDVAPIE